jgi:hypothetical protein
MSWIKSAIHDWRSFRQQSWRDRLTLLEAYALLPASSLALWVLGYRRWHALLARLAPRPPQPAAPELQVASAVRTARLVRAANRRSVRPAACLSRSLTLWWLLRRRGIESQLRLGVRKGGEGLEAHAWVELAGRVVNDAADVARQYAPFAEAILPKETSEPDA